MKEKIYSRDIVLILIACLLYMGSLQMVMPILAGFTGELGGSGVLMGIICAMLYYSSIVSRPIVGHMTDKHSKFKMAVIGMVLMIIGPLSYVFAKSYVVVIIGRLLNGIGFAFSSISLTTWISLLMPKEHIGRGMGMFGMMNAIAIAFSPLIGKTLRDIYGYRVAFAVAAAFATIALILILLITDKGDPKEQGNIPTEKKKLQIADPKILYIAGIMFCFSIPQMSNQAFLLKYAETRGLDLNTGLYFTVYAVVLFLMRLIFKDMFDTVGFNKFVYISSACTILAMASFTFMKSNILLYSAAFFMAGSFGLMTSVCQTQCIKKAGPGRRGIANSTYYIGMDLGSGFGTMLGGIIYDKLPIEYFYPIICLVVPIALLTYFCHATIVKIKSMRLQKSI